MGDLHIDKRGSSYGWVMKSDNERIVIIITTDSATYDVQYKLLYEH